MGREELHLLIDKIDAKQINMVYQLLLCCVSDSAEVDPLPDEIIGIKKARREIAEGKIYKHNEVFGAKTTAQQ